MKLIIEPLFRTAEYLEAKNDGTQCLLAALLQQQLCNSNN